MNIEKKSFSSTEEIEKLVKETREELLEIKDETISIV